MNVEDIAVDGDILNDQTNNKLVEPDGETWVIKLYTVISDNTGAVDVTPVYNDEPVIDYDDGAADAASIHTDDIGTADATPIYSNGTYKIVSWIDVSKDNVITTGRRQRQRQR